LGLVYAELDAFLTAPTRFAGGGGGGTFGSPAGGQKSGGNYGDSYTTSGNYTDPYPESKVPLEALPSYDSPDFSAEISIGVVPSSEPVRRNMINNNDADNDLSALVEELATSGSVFDSKYGVGSGSSSYHPDEYGHDSGNYSSNDTGEDQLAAALAALETTENFKHD